MSSLKLKHSDAMHNLRKLAQVLDFKNFSFAMYCILSGKYIECYIIVNPSTNKISL